jgi:hypothetical protein
MGKVLIYLDVDPQLSIPIGHIGLSRGCVLVDKMCLAFMKRVRRFKTIAPFLCPDKSRFANRGAEPRPRNVTSGKTAL